MLISDTIAKLIEEMIENGSGSVEIRRNDLAEQLGCVPSQINYVISSRFTPERGFIIESKRGGGGYVRIVRKAMTKSDFLMHAFQAVGNRISENDAKAFVSNIAGTGIMSVREASIVCTALSERALAGAPPEARDSVRADILKHIILSLM